MYENDKFYTYVVVLNVKESPQVIMSTTNSIVLNSNTQHGVNNNCM